MTIYATAWAVALALSLTAPTYAYASEPTTTLAAISLNGRSVSVVEEIFFQDDGVLLPRSRWEEFGVVVPKNLGSGLVNSTQLSAIVVFDEAKQAYSITVPAKFLPKQAFASHTYLNTNVSRSARGVMLGYDISAAQNQGDTFASLGYQLQSNMFSGSLFYTAQYNTTPSGSEHARALTTWTKDLYNIHAVVQVGDVFSTPRNAALGGTVNLAGARIGSDVALHGAPLYPVPLLGGVADTRSTAEILLNDVSSHKTPLEPGPYQFSNMSYRNGLNDVSLRVRDEFGRESFISRSVYVLPASLRQGAHEWELQAGLVRNGNTGDNYGRMAVSGFYARGLTDRWTMTTSAQFAAGRSNIVLGNMWNMGRFGAVTLDLAKGGDGNGYTVAYERRSRYWSVSASHTQMSDDYWWQGDIRGSSVRALHATSVSGSVTNGRVTANLSYTDIGYANGRERQLIAARARYRLSSKNELSLFASVEQSTGDKEVMLGWRHRFDGNTTGYLTARAAPEITYNAQLNGSGSLAGVPYTWGASNTDTGSGRTTYVSGRAQFSTVELGLSASSGDYNETQLSARGGLWIGQGGVVPTRMSHGSWAVVRVPGQPNVKLVAGGRRVTTNRNGTAIVADLPSLMENDVSIDAQTLDQSIEVDGLKNTVVAPRNGGVDVLFATKANTIRQYQLMLNGVPYAPKSLIYKNASVTVGSDGVFVLNNPAFGEHIYAQGTTQCTAEITSSLDPYEIVKIDCQGIDS